MLARKPLGASFVIFTPFCRIATGNLRIDMLSQAVRRYDGLSTCCIHNSEIVAEGDKVLVGGIRSQPKAEILVNLFRVLLIQQPLQSGHPGRCQVTVLEKNPSTVLR